MRLLVTALLVAIIVSLCTALMYVCGEQRQNAKRAVKALIWRVALSMALFLLLIGGHYFGWITGHL